MFLAKSKDRIEKRFTERMIQLPEKIRLKIMDQIEGLDEDAGLALKYLYAAMPYSDIGNYEPEIFADYAVHGVKLFNTCEYIKHMPEEIFLNYVLYHRVNEEEIASCRSIFYDHLSERVKHMPMKEAALEVNYWCGEEATYQTTDDRTLTPLAVYHSGYGRCGEESALGVSANRSIGIPSRQVYAPKWSHCDDNHAWVEVWCEGTWYFMGACEAEPILNKGWFTNASSRAMMVHSRWFDWETPHADHMGGIPEQCCGKEGMNIMLNQTVRYAKVQEIRVRVLDSNRQPLAGVKVDFQILNYSEFSNIAAMITGQNGEVQLTTGYGSLLIHASMGEAFSEIIMNTETHTNAELILENQISANRWEDFDMNAPHDAAINADRPTPTQKTCGDSRLEKSLEKRLEKMKNMKFPEIEAFLKDREGLELRKKMLEVLTEKDKVDVKCSVLNEHVQYAASYQKNVSEEIFLKYIWNPRVDDEVITAYRRYILDYFTQQERDAFSENPREIWHYIDTEIQSIPEEERESLITTPKACLELKVGSELSKKVLFICIARTLGIPSRLSPIDKAMEYRDGEEFVRIIGNTVKSARLILSITDENVQWNYFQNWTIAKCENGSYVTLKLADKEWEENKMEVELEPGTYRILTTNRLPNGNIFGRQYCFKIEDEEIKEIVLSLREANLEDILHHIEMQPFSLWTESGEVVQGADITRDRTTLLMFLEEGKEPTEHILNELMERKTEFANGKGKIVFVIRSKDALQDPTFEKCLEVIPKVEIYYDDFKEIINTLGRRMYVDPDKLPMILVTKGELNGVYATSGYNVGTGDMLLRIMEL